jgi:hypothetical protein
MWPFMVVSPSSGGCKPEGFLSTGGLVSISMVT